MMRKQPQTNKKIAVKSSKKIVNRKSVVVSINKAVRITQLGDGFARFTFAPQTIPAFSSRNFTVNGGGYNIISGSWYFTGTQQGYVLNNYSSGESTWYFTAWNPSNVARSAYYVVIAKLKP